MKKNFEVLKNEETSRFEHPYVIRVKGVVDVCQFKKLRRQTGLVYRYHHRRAAEVHDFTLIGQIEHITALGLKLLGWKRNKRNIRHFLSERVPGWMLPEKA